jgi:MinD superfamily P-loop ATPase
LADYVVLITEPTPFGLSDLKQSVETLRSMGKSCAVIINRDGLGNNDVADYLEDENIPLLMKIPFDKNIASSYSKGEILARNEPEWEKHFNNLYNKIIEAHGNSRN